MKAENRRPFAVMLTSTLLVAVALGNPQSAKAQGPPLRLVEIVEPLPVPVAVANDPARTRIAGSFVFTCMSAAQECRDFHRTGRSTSSLRGAPLEFQRPRTIRFGLKISR